MYTTEQIITFLAEDCRKTMSLIAGKKKAYGARVLFDQVTDTLKRRDPEAAKILRRLAMERLRVVSGEDPEAAGLIVTPEINLVLYIAQKKGGHPSIAEAFADMMNR